MCQGFKIKKILCHSNRRNLWCHIHSPSSCERHTKCQTKSKHITLITCNPLDFRLPTFSTSPNTTLNPAHEKEDKGEDVIVTRLWLYLREYKVIPGQEKQTSGRIHIYREDLEDGDSFVTI